MVALASLVGAGACFQRLTRKCVCTCTTIQPDSFLSHESLYRVRHFPLGVPGYFILKINNTCALETNSCALFLSVFSLTYLPIVLLCLRIGDFFPI